MSWRVTYTFYPGTMLVTNRETLYTRTYIFLEIITTNLRNAFKFTRTLLFGHGSLCTNWASSAASVLAEFACNSSEDSFLMLSINGLTTGFSFSGSEWRLEQAPANAACTLLKQIWEEQTFNSNFRNIEEFYEKRFIMLIQVIAWTHVNCNILNSISTPHINVLWISEIRQYACRTKYATFSCCY